MLSGDIVPQSARIRDELIALLEQFVQMIASHATIDLRDAPEFRTAIYQLCEKAPEVAQAIAGMIEESSKLESPEDLAKAKMNTIHSIGRKRKADYDFSYRPPKSIKVGNTPDHVDKSSNESSSDPNCRTPKSGEIATEDDKAPQASSQTRGEGPRDNDGLKGEKSAIAASEAFKPSAKISRITLAPSKSKKPQPEALVDAPAEMIPITPTRRIDDTPSLPQTEEIHRNKIPASVASITSSCPSTPDYPFAATASVKELILQAVRTLHRLSKHRDGVPSDVHRRILQSFQGDHSEVLAASTGNQWSDGSMWVQVLEMGSSQQNKITILNMLEYMGAWEWYDGQVRLAQATISTKKGKQVDRRGAAIHVLNSMQDSQMHAAGRGRWISGLGMVALEQDESNSMSKSGPASIIESEKRSQRKHISMQLSRGQKLSIKLVKELGFGILFSQKIWEYTKMSMNRLDDLVRHIQANPQHVKLLQTLSSQLERLVKNGSPDLHVFYDDLREGELISEGELRELQVSFALDGDALPDGVLNAAVDRLIEDVKVKVLNQTTFDDDDTLAVNGSMELSCEIFQRLRPGEWLDAWTIMAAMQLSDKPAFVRHDISSPLDTTGSDNQIRPIKRPLAGWAKKIAKHRRQAKEIFGGVVSLVYFCPINHQNSHFTLLEINEREQVIRHYDSMAEPGTMQGVKETRISRLVKEEFGGLKFSYQEAPTPQQSDGWSCGMRVIWNFRRLSNSLPIGLWDTVLSPEPMILEIVEGLVTCVEGNAMRRYR